jgi:hypothetical protein
LEQEEKLISQEIIGGDFMLKRTGVISVICMAFLLLFCGSCGAKQNSNDQPWLPVDKDYLRMPTATWEALVADGEIAESEIVFPVGGGFFKKAVYSSQSREIAYLDSEFVFYGRLMNSQLPSLLSSVRSWMGDTKEYRLTYRDLDQTGQAEFDYTLPTAICNLKQMEIQQLWAPYIGEWDYGVLYISNDNTILWQLILTV